VTQQLPYLQICGTKVGTSYKKRRHSKINSHGEYEEAIGRLHNFMSECFDDNRWNQFILGNFFFQKFQFKNRFDRNQNVWILLFKNYSLDLRSNRTYSRKLNIRKVRSFSKIPRLLSTLPSQEKVVKKSEFPTLTKFLTELIHRGLFEIISQELMEYRLKKLNPLDPGAMEYSPIKSINKLFFQHFTPASRIEGIILPLRTLALWATRSELVLSGSLYSEIKDLPIPEHMHEILMLETTT